MVSDVLIEMGFVRILINKNVFKWTIPILNINW
jgi:hypothetical protein